MKKFLLMFSCVACIALTSSVSAETLFISGASGVRDQTNSNCSDLYIPAGELQVLASGSGNCLFGYPINLPVGKIIDSIEVAYDNASFIDGNPSITAYLAQNRVKPKLGAIAISGASAQPKNGSQGFLNMQVNHTVANGSVYWVQIFDNSVTEVNYVAVTYH